MGLKEEYERGRRWVAENLTLSLTKSSLEVSVFETTIRYLGGLLSIYSLTGDELYRCVQMYSVQLSVQYCCTGRRL